jgi:predicted metalloendopeptidase
MIHRPAWHYLTAFVLILAIAVPAAAVEGGLDLAGMDTTVAPGDNFFLYTNGGWIKTTEIPVDRSNYGTGAILSEQIETEVAELIKGAADAASSDIETRKVGDAFAAFMDEAAIESKGIDPLKRGLKQISTIADKKALAAYLGSSLRVDVDVLNSTNLHTDNFLGLWIAADLDQPMRYLPFVLQGGLSLPDREYYLDQSPRMADIREKYKTHIIKILALAGIEDGEAKAQRIIDLETKIARVHVSRADSEDAEKGDNHWSRDTFVEKAPGVDWTSLWDAAGLTDQWDYVVWQPSALIGEAALVGLESIDTWKDYLTFHYIDSNSYLLPKAFADERFAFYGHVLSGTPQQRPRWKRAITVTDTELGEAVGKLYVAKYFPPESKVAVQAIVANLIEAFGKRIDRLDWMSPETKEKAKAKLATLKVGIGYPDHWVSYDGLTILKDDAFGNAQRASLFDTRRKLARLKELVDRDEWVMNPQLVNAVNLPVLNALNFPAAILQPPYFDPAQSDAANYGSIGAIIGHEISHSFDDQGALFDASGRLKNWWTPDDFAHFKASSAQLVKQFNSYKPFPDLAINGQQTVDENIADLAGLSVAYDGYRQSLDGKEAPKVDGMTGDQQFFLSFAHSWRTKMREPALRQRVLTDGHAPGQYRALTVRNLDPWYAAFDVKPNQELYLSPRERVRIW